MTSRFPAEALRPASPTAAILVDFLDYLDKWEAGTSGKQGFLSDSTATGLRVTLASTLSLLQYLTETLRFKYLMTSRLSTDPVEHLFGIIRQSSGCNSHPSPEQFLITVNCLSFYNLARSVDGANATPEAISALLNVSDKDKTITPKTVDELLAQGKLDQAETSLVKVPPANDQHLPLVVEKSDSRLIYYMAGYVARKCVLKLNCASCKDILLVEPNEAAVHHLPSEYTKHCDWGGLLYPSKNLYCFVAELENLFTECFSTGELHANSISDVISLVRQTFIHSNAVGCSVHKEEISMKVVSFYVLTRLHFLVKGLNSENSAKRKRAKLAKLSRSV